MGFATLWQPQLMIASAMAMAGYLALAGPFSRSRPAADAATPLQRSLFVLMLAVLYLTLGSPVDWLSDNAFFSVRSAQHIADTLVVPPLFLYGTPRWLVRKALEWRPLGAAWRALTRPAAALLVWGGVLAVWHVPFLYDRTLVDGMVHLTAHATILVAGLVFWWPALSPIEEMPRLADLPLTLYFLLGVVVNWPLFYVLCLYPHTALYAFYVDVYRRWGVASPSAFAYSDQRLGGMLTMAAMMVTLGGWMGRCFFRWCSTQDDGADDGRAAPPFTASSPTRSGIARP